MLDLIVSVAGIYACFLSWGVLQEKLTTTLYGPTQEKYKFFIVLNMIQAFTAGMVALIYLKVTFKKLKSLNKGLAIELVKASLTNILASPFGYAALKHINYPTVTLAKSCKLVPVMLMNIVLYRRKFPFYKYMSVVLVTVGVSSFMLFKETSKKSTTQNSYYGLLLVTLNLLMDGITNATQDHIFRTYKLSSLNMMFYMQIFSASIMFLYLLAPISDELSLAITFIQTYPRVIYDILAFSLCGAVGQCFIFHIIEKYGSLVLVTVTVTRKLFSIILSLFWFSHSINFNQIVAIAVVFTGIGLETYFKMKG